MHNRHVEHVDGDPTNNELSNIKVIEKGCCKDAPHRGPCGYMGTCGNAVDDRVLNKVASLAESYKQMEPEVAAEALRAYEEKRASNSFPSWKSFRGRSGGKSTLSVDLCPQGGTILCLNEEHVERVRAMCLRLHRPDIEVKVLIRANEVEPDQKVHIALECVLDGTKAIQYFSSEDPHARRALAEGIPRVQAKSKNFHDWYSNQTKAVPK